MRKGNWLGKDGAWYEDYWDWKAANNRWDQQERLIKAVNRQNGVNSVLPDDMEYELNSLWVLIGVPAFFGIFICILLTITQIIKIPLGILLTISLIFIFIYAKRKDDEAYERRFDKYKNITYEEDTNTTPDNNKIEIIIKDSNIKKDE